MHEVTGNRTLKGTICGTLMAVAVSVDPADLLKTAVMAATGAAVSFGMSVLLKWLQEKFK